MKKPLTYSFLANAGGNLYLSVITSPDPRDAWEEYHAQLAEELMLESTDEVKPLDHIIQVVIHDPNPATEPDSHNKVLTLPNRIEAYFTMGLCTGIRFNPEIPEHREWMTVLICIWYTLSLEGDFSMFFDILESHKGYHHFRVAFQLDNDPTEVKTWLKYHEDEFKAFENLHWKLRKN